MPTLLLTRSRTLLIAALVTLLFMIGIFTSDIYVPALPVMANDLQASQMQMELSVGLYFLSFALSQVVYGPFADHYGRKPVIIFGLSLALLGSIICLLAKNGEMLILGRLIQGAGMGSPMPLGRVVLRDLFNGVQLARWNSYVGACLLIAPALAPIIGGYIAYAWDWPSIFTFLIFFIVFILLATRCFLPETRAPVSEPLLFEFKDIFNHYIHILKNKTFLAYALVAAIALSGMVAYLTLSSFLFQTKLGFTIVEYSWISIFVSTALIGGMLSNAWLLYYFHYNSLIKIGLLLECLAGVLLVIATTLGYFNAINLVLSIMLFSFGCSLIFANASSGAFNGFNHRLGMVGGLYGATQMFLAGSVGTLVSLAQNNADFVLALSFLLLGVIGFGGFFILLKKN